MGLGSLDAVSLADARLKAADCRKLIDQGKDPIEVREAQRAASAAQAAQAATFDECVQSYVAAHRAGWRNVKHAAQWESTLATYASPVFGRLPCAPWSSDTSSEFWSQFGLRSLKLRVESAAVSKPYSIGRPPVDFET